MNTTVEHIAQDDLPAEWLAPLGLKPGQKVRLTIEAQPKRRRFDREGIEVLIKRVSALPILDDRSDDDILGYDACGLPQ